MAVVILQVLMMGFTRLIALVYLAYFYHAVAKANPQAPEGSGAIRASESSGQNVVANGPEDSKLQAALVENEHK